MRVRRLHPLLAALAAVGAACSDPTSAPAPLRPAARPALGVVSGGAFADNFNFDGAIARLDTVFGVSGDPAVPPPMAVNPVWALIAPRPWKPSDFDVTMHLRDRAVWDAPESFRAMHGTLCQPYDNGSNVARPDDGITHDARTFDDMNYRCRNHMMTAIRASGYGAVYLTPNARVSIGGGEATIRWAMSTFRTSANDWIDLWITPPEDHLKLPLDGSLASTDLQGPPRRAIHVRMTSASQTQSRFEIYQVNDHAETLLATSPPYENVVVTQSATRRDTFEVRLSASEVKFRMWKGDVRAPSFGYAEPYASLPWTVATLPVALTWGSGVVQFGHHSMAQTTAGVGGTWHWDDFQISPAVGFTIIRASNPEAPTATNNRYADSKHPDMVLQSPTAAPGVLRFGGYGDRFQVSYDGAKWIDAEKAPEKLDLDGRFHSYRVAIPAGVSRVSFKAKKDKAASEATNKDDGNWRARDVTVWY